MELFFTFMAVMLVVFVAFIAVAVWHMAYGIGTEKHGNNHPTEKGCKAADTLKEYAHLVDIMKCKQDDVSLNKILAFPDVNSKEEKCIKHRNDLGNELYDDEIMKCYFKNN